MTQSATLTATGAGVAVVAMVGLVALVAAKTLRGDATASSTEATNLLDAEPAIAVATETTTLLL